LSSYATVNDTRHTSLCCHGIDNGVAGAAVEACVDGANDVDWALMGVNGAKVTV
jgi:hypothetical protein